MFPFLLLILHLAPLIHAQCPIYTSFASTPHPPLSAGRWQLSSMRPIAACRTFKSPEVEATIERLRKVIVDPDLMRLFENAWPSTLDTTVAWTGVANRSVKAVGVGEGVGGGDGTGSGQLGGEVVDEEETATGAYLYAPGADGNADANANADANSNSKREKQEQDADADVASSTASKGETSKDDEGEEEELTFVITGDIEAMWLRDSANQLQAYTSVLRSDGGNSNATRGKTLASLFRGAINLQARYILGDPFCNAFQAPEESGIPRRSSQNSDTISPPYDYMQVFSCQWELDSVASFLQLSADYAARTGDYDFFAKHSWVEAVEKVLQITKSMMISSYDDAGNWLHTPYTYCAPYGGTPINDCNGSPHRGHIGLVRSFQRPSDDSCIYQYLIPSNMMYSVALNASSLIMSHVAPSNSNLTSWMRSMASGIRTGIERHATLPDPKHGAIYAYEIDGYGSAISMDDPNVPSLLSAPYLNYTSRTDPVYAATRRKILSKDNPYYAWGPVIEGVGSMHTLPGRAWPMANIMAILTSEDDEEIVRHLRWLVGSTGGLGLMHESVHAHTEGVFSRPWFSWANGLFGQAMLDIEKRKPWILKRGFQ